MGNKEPPQPLVGWSWRE